VSLIPWTAADYRKYDVTVIIHHKGGNWNCALRIIMILESLTAWGILLRTVGQIWVFLRACLLRWWSNTYTCAHTRSKHNKEDDDLQLLITPFITARKIAGIYWVISSCFNSVYSPILFSYMLVPRLFNWVYESVSPNTKLNLITW